MQFLRRIRNIFFVSNKNKRSQILFTEEGGGPWVRASRRSSYCTAYRLQPALQTIAISKVQGVQNAYDKYFKNFLFAAILSNTTR